MVINDGYTLWFYTVVIHYGYAETQMRSPNVIKHKQNLDDNLTNVHSDMNMEQCSHPVLLSHHIIILLDIM